jgi:hypothetical protein
MKDEQGVPEDLLVGDDYMQVRSGLVALLKSANAALVWTRIEFRHKHVAFSHQHDGRSWWEVTEQDLGAQVGLSREAVGRAIDKLVAGGYLLAEQHSLPMQTFSYSPVVVQSAESHIGKPVGDIAPSKRRNRALQNAESTIAPLYKEAEEGEDTLSANLGDPLQGTQELFEAAWKHWPRKESKKKAWEKFARHPRPVDLAVAIGAHGDAHAKFTPPQFVPHLVTWLNQERWNDPLPAPRGPASPGVVARGRDADAILRAEAESGRLAVGA